MVGMAAILLQLLVVPVISAEATEDPNLDIVQIKVTSDNQFVTIYNPGENPKSLSDYELIYLNADKKPTKTFVFSGQLGPKSYFVLNDGQFEACHLMTLESVSMGFSTTGGSVQLWHYEDEFTKILDASVSWVKTEKSDTPKSTLILPTSSEEFLNKADEDWLVVKPSNDNPCQLETIKVAEESEVTQVVFNLLPPTMPPVRYVSSVSDSKSSINRNPGKMSPVVNELLPNPASPLTDADDEFIELYNPNNSNFDLTDFQLAFGSNNPRKYTFPEGTVLKPGEFRAFTSGNTSIGLSNTEAQVWLLNPTGEVVSQSEPYSSAKDGQAWALNNGNWQWTAAPSPNESNTLTTESSSEDKEGAAAVLGISSSGSGTPGATLASATTNPSQLADAAPLHPLVLAGVGLLAVGYAVYEYRHDIGNTIHKSRRYFKLRRSLR